MTHKYKFEVICKRPAFKELNVKLKEKLFQSKLRLEADLTVWESIPDKFMTTEAEINISVGGQILIEAVEESLNSMYEGSGTTFMVLSVEKIHV